MPSVPPIANLRHQNRQTQAPHPCRPVLPSSANGKPPGSSCNACATATLCPRAG